MIGGRDRSQDSGVRIKSICFPPSAFCLLHLRESFFAGVPDMDKMSRPTMKETAVTLENPNEQSRNIYENKGATFSNHVQAGNVIENKVVIRLRRECC